MYSRALGKNAAFMRSRLNAKHHHRVGTTDARVQVVGVLTRPPLDTDRQEGRWRHERDLRTKSRQQQHVAARNSAVQHVADDDDRSSLEVSEMAAHGERIEQGLRGVFVRAVTGVDNRSADPAGVSERVRRAARAVPMTTASAPMASSVRAVSFRLSPLETLDPLALKLMTSADSRLAAASNEMRVRVESSKNRFTTVRPRECRQASSPVDPTAAPARLQCRESTWHRPKRQVAS